jgi:hypothetical protein
MSSAGDYRGDEGKDKVLGCYPQALDDCSGDGKRVRRSLSSVGVLVLGMLDHLGLVTVVEEMYRDVQVSMC